MAANVLAYNAASAREFGWSPDWFDCAAMDLQLVQAVRRWQRTNALPASGRVDAVAYYRLSLARRKAGLPIGLSPEVLYNRVSAHQLDWKPQWFGGRANDAGLVAEIRSRQKAYGLSRTGRVDVELHRRVLADREAKAPVRTATVVASRPARHIVFHGKAVPIAWDKVVLWTEPGGLSLTGFKPGPSNGPRPVGMFVNHWDVCLSSKSCAGVLEKRGLSVHFLVDNDGTIYQCLDMHHVAQHAAPINTLSVGVEVSNAYDVKHQAWYESHGFGPRPIRQGVTVHGGTLGPFLGFYPVQLDALTALWAAVHVATGIPLEVPLDADGALVTTEDQRVRGGRFRGFVNHYNVRRGKIDCAGLDMRALVAKAAGHVAAAKRASP